MYVRLVQDFAWGWRDDGFTDSDGFYCLLVCLAEVHSAPVRGTDLNVPNMRPRGPGGEEEKGAGCLKTGRVRRTDQVRLIPLTEPGTGLVHGSCPFYARLDEAVAAVRTGFARHAGPTKKGKATWVAFPLRWRG